MKTRNLFLIILVMLLTLSAQDKIDIKLKMISGDEKMLSEISSNKPILVNFWALWCKPCRSEMKALNNLYNGYREKGFNILGINIDTPRSSAKVESFIKTLGINYSIAVDPNSELFNKFNGQVLPLNILYDSEGNVIYRHTGYLPGDEIKLEKEISKALGITE